MNRFIAVIAAMKQGLLDENCKKSRLMVPQERRGENDAKNTVLRECCRRHFGRGNGPPRRQ